jgi:hypothetical protein
MFAYTPTATSKVKKFVGGLTYRTIQLQLTIRLLADLDYFVCLLSSDPRRQSRAPEGGCLEHAQQQVLKVIADGPGRIDRR